MKISSFDIFDTCLLRKCGTPLDFYDVLSYRVFSQNVSENVRKDFAVARKKAEAKVWQDNPRLTLEDIYAELKFEHVALLLKEELTIVEMKLERKMLIPSLKVKEIVDKERRKGNRIIFISDMYLPHDFIQEILVEYGFFKEGDGLYISNEYGLTKQSGVLFMKVQEIEKVCFRNWQHYGDNPHGDVRVPKALGIKSRRVVNEYTPYPSLWKHSYVSLYNYPSVLAGISRALYHSQENDSHKAFVLDLVAPFYCSFAYRVLEEAQRRGVSRLYFCARDTYQLYNIARRFSHLFPGIKIEYLYISRESLYNGDDDAKILYFKSVGLATQEDSVAIVDITTSGKTILELNNYLVSKGFKKTYGFFFLLWDDPREIPVDKEWCHFEIETSHIQEQRKFDNFLNHLFVFENFFALNNQSRTVDYQIQGDIAEPVFDSKISDIETIHINREYWSKRHKDLLEGYVDMYIECGLYHYSDEVLISISIPELCSFFDVPEALYLTALEDYKVFSSSYNSHIPYVLNCGLFRLLLKRGKDSVWSRGTIVNSAPGFLRPVLRNYYARINNTIVRG